MATGGYARDKEFMKHEVPFLEHTLNSASEGATSGALKSMIRAGARPVQLSLYRFSFALPTEDLIWGVAIDAATGARYARRGSWPQSDFDGFSLRHGQGGCQALHHLG